MANINILLWNIFFSYFIFFYYHQFHIIYLISFMSLISHFYLIVLSILPHACFQLLIFSHSCLKLFYLCLHSYIFYLFYSSNPTYPFYFDYISSTRYLFTSLTAYVSSARYLYLSHSCLQLLICIISLIPHLLYLYFQ